MALWIPQVRDFAPKLGAAAEMAFDLLRQIAGTHVHLSDSFADEVKQYPLDDRTARHCQ